MIRPVLLAFVATAVCVSVSGCATSNEPSRYTADLERLTADCQARQGILTPTGATTGRAQADYACTISSASRLD